MRAPGLGHRDVPSVPSTLAAPLGGRRLCSGSWVGNGRWELGPQELPGCRAEDAPVPGQRPRPPACGFRSPRPSRAWEHVPGDQMAALPAGHRAGTFKAPPVAAGLWLITGGVRDEPRSQTHRAPRQNLPPGSHFTLTLTLACQSTGSCDLGPPRSTPAEASRGSLSGSPPPPLLLDLPAPLE